jgi:hypothetical protein
MDGGCADAADPVTGSLAISVASRSMVGAGRWRLRDPAGPVGPEGGLLALVMGYPLATRPD